MDRGHGTFSAGDGNELDVFERHFPMDLEYSVFKTLFHAKRVCS